MKTFTIENDTNNITAHPTAKEAESVTGAEHFATAAALAGLAAHWPGARLVEIWNSLPGATPVRKFKDRKTAVTRLWNFIQGLGEPSGSEGRTQAPRRAGEGRGGQEGDPHAENAQICAPGQRRPSGQQDGEDPRSAEAARRSQPESDHEGHRMAGALGAGLYLGHAGREDGPEGRFRQNRRRGAHLLHQCLNQSKPVSVRRRIPLRRLFLSGHSCRQPRIVLSNRIERAPVAFERGFLPGQPLPALDHHVDILGIEFQSATDAPGQLPPPPASCRCRGTDRRPVRRAWCGSGSAAASARPVSASDDRTSPHPIHP